MSSHLRPVLHVVLAKETDKCLLFDCLAISNMLWEQRLNLHLILDEKNRHRTAVKPKQLIGFCRRSCVPRAQ